MLFLFGLLCLALLAFVILRAIFRAFSESDSDGPGTYVAPSYRSNEEYSAPRTYVPMVIPVPVESNRSSESNWTSSSSSDSSSSSSSSSDSGSSPSSCSSSNDTSGGGSFGGGDFGGGGSADSY
jgi:hypothetical protein